MKPFLGALIIFIPALAIPANLSIGPSDPLTPVNHK